MIIFYYIYKLLFNLFYCFPELVRDCGSFNDYFGVGRWVIFRISEGRLRLRICAIFMREGVLMVLNSF